jgi:thiol-disulfide isomerase/thioredoxin
MQRLLLAALTLLTLHASAPASAAGISQRAPELTGLDAWINAEPQSLAALRGRVVVVNFWTFGCHNCRNTLPFVSQWHRRFADRGLVILGIHTPELSFERPHAAVEAAVRAQDIQYPVAVDGSSKTWNAYGNRYWPAFYFVDKRGVIRHVRFGEGGYAESERWIERLLAEP